MSKIIDEIREITAEAVAKKQDAAKINFPKLIETIRLKAPLGSSCTFAEEMINEYDKKLLIAEGFTVSLIDKKPDPRYEPYKEINRAFSIKLWEVRW